MIKVLLGMTAVVFVNACSNHHPAPVTDSRNKKAISSAQPLSKQNKYRAKYVHVKKGDTLYSIGFSHNIDFRKLAKINNIHLPYRIYPGQRLKLKPEKSSSKNKVTVHKLTQSTSHVADVTHKNNKVITHNNTKPVQKPTKKPTTPIVTTAKPVVNPQTQITPVSNSRWIWPVKGKIISTFSQTDTARKGLDIASKLGADVYASNHGTVVYSGDGLRGYGELIIIKHSNNLLSAYAHNSKRLVKEGVSVKQGQVIAYSGKGTDSKPLLHFEIRKNGRPVNPLKYLPKNK